MTTPTAHPDELLPWYVNGTLSPAERHEVERHLEHCARCRDEVALLRNLRQQIQAQRDEFQPGDLVRQRVMNEIQRKATRPSRRPNWLAVAAMLVIVIQAGLIVNLWTPKQDIVPLGDTSAGAVLQIRFVPSANETQIRTALQAAQATLIDGPSAIGVYRIRLHNLDPNQAQQIQARIQLLQTHREAIDYVALER